MIKTEKQFRDTQKKMQQFKNYLDELERTSEIDEYLKILQVNGLIAQIGQFSKEIDEYLKLKEEDIHCLYGKSIEDVPKILIQARIARDWTQGQLAQRLEMNEQQIQRYESSDYSGASIERISEIFEALELEFAPFRIDLRKAKYNFSEKLDNELIKNAKEKLRSIGTVLAINH